MQAPRGVAAGRLLPNDGAEDSGFGTGALAPVRRGWGLGAGGWRKNRARARPATGYPKYS